LLQSGAAHCSSRSALILKSHPSYRRREGLKATAEYRVEARAINAISADAVQVEAPTSNRLPCYGGGLEIRAVALARLEDGSG